MFSLSKLRLPWWNFCTERKTKSIMMAGGVATVPSKNAYHRTYIRKYKKGHFPNRTRSHWNVSMKGLHQQRPKRLPWPYDLSSMLFNQPSFGSDKIGYVVDTKLFKTSIVASSYLVYYPRYNMKVARTGRYQAHDEDLATVEGDLVHIKQCRKISARKHYYIFSILDPNIEGRERLKLGLPCVPPPMFGYPTTRRTVKLNLTSQEATKEKLASSIQESVQDFYAYAGTSARGAAARLQEESEQSDQQNSFDAANRLVGIENSSPTTPDQMLDGDGSGRQIGDGLGGGDGDDGAGGFIGEVEVDHRTKKGEEYYPQSEAGKGHHGQGKGQRTP